MPNDVESLVSENIWLAHVIAGRTPAMDSQESLSAAMGGLLEAAERWNGAGRFVGYASRIISLRIADKRRMIWGRWIDGRRTGGEHKGQEVHYVYLNDVLADETDQLCGAIPSDERDWTETLVRDDEAAVLVGEALGCLSEIERYVVESMHHLNGHPEEYLHEVAEKFDLTESRICQIRHAALKKMRGWLGRHVGLTTAAG